MDGFLFFTHAVRSRHSFSRQMLQKLGVFTRFDPLVLIKVLFINLLNIVGEPWCVRVVDIESLAFECFHLLDFLRGWHRRLELFIRVELVRLDVIAQEKLCAVFNIQVTSCVFNGLNSLSRSIGHLESDRCFESAELFASLAEKLDAFSDLA